MYFFFIHIYKHKWNISENKSEISFLEKSLEEDLKSKIKCWTVVGPFELWIIYDIRYINKSRQL